MATAPSPSPPFCNSIHNVYSLFRYPEEPGQSQSFKRLDPYHRCKSVLSLSSRPALPLRPQSKTSDPVPFAASAAQTALPLHGCQTSFGCTTVPRVPGRISTSSRSSLSLQVID